MTRDEKVIKKVNKILRWIEHGGGMSEIWFAALSVVVFKMYEEAGYTLTMSPQGQDNTTEPNGEVNARPEPSRIIITDF
jgi:hypothetical protein